MNCATDTSLDEIAQRMRRWANHGFLVGLLDAAELERSRKAVILPSTALIEKIARNVPQPGASADAEMRRHLDSAFETVNDLMSRESALIGRRYRLMTFGLFVRAGIAAAAVIGITWLTMDCFVLWLCLLLLAFAGKASACIKEADRAIEEAAFNWGDIAFIGGPQVSGQVSRP
jgi:hypothetical protein